MFKDLDFYATRSKGPFTKGKSQHRLPNCFLFARRAESSQHIVTGQRRLRKEILDFEAGCPVYFSIPDLNMFIVVCLTYKVAMGCPRQPGEAVSLQTSLLGLGV